MCSKLLILTICLWASTAQSAQIQGTFTKEQIQRIFHRDPSEVPNYETINVQTEDGHRSKRETRPVEFQIDGKTVQLTLNPAKHDSLPYWTPVWTVESTRQAPYHTFKKLNEDEYKMDGTLYQDPQKMATLLAYYRDQNIYYDGVFGESKLAKVVRSVPEKWWKVPDRDFTDDHVVYGVETADGTTKALKGSTQNLEKLDKPLNVLYPKLLLVIENSYFRKFGENVSELMRYQSTFWNSVNLEYSKIASPEVKIMITGVIIAKDDLALKYIYDARDKADMNKLNFNQMINDGGKYFKNEFHKYVDFSNYDATITLVNLDSGVVLGSAYLGLICHEERNVGFMRDDASYEGLQTATHELGHLLNLPHDGEDCRASSEGNVGTIMSAVAVSVEKYIWSDCSKNTLRDFSTDKKAECLKNQHRRRN